MIETIEWTTTDDGLPEYGVKVLLGDGVSVAAGCLVEDKGPQRTDTFVIMMRLVGHLNPAQVDRWAQVPMGKDQESQ